MILNLVMLIGTIAVAVVIYRYANNMPESKCSQNCNQGRQCNCKGK